MSFGEIIKKLRLEKNWTQEYVATKLKISVGALSRYESSMYEPKSLQLLKDIAELYGVSTDYLLGKTKIKNDTSFKLTDDEIYFINHVKKLDENQKQIIKNTMEAFLDNKEN